MPGMIDPGCVVFTPPSQISAALMAADQAQFGQAVAQAMPGAPALMMIPQGAGNYIVLACSGPNQSVRQPFPVELARLAAKLRGMIVTETTDPNMAFGISITLGADDDAILQAVLAAGLAAASPSEAIAPT